MKCLIDADVLLHEIGHSGQFKDKETGEEVILSPDHVFELLDKKIDVIKEMCMADEDPILFITSSEKLVEMWNQKGKWMGWPELTHEPNFRFAVAVTKPYKGNRKNPKPFHFFNLFQYMVDSYNVIVSQGGIEADDAICTYQTEAKDRGEETIICSRDKDLRICPGWHYSWECGGQPAYGPEETDPLGWIKQYKFGKTPAGSTTYEVMGYGLSFFLYQLLIGDAADNIPGLKSWGKAKAWDLLSPLQGDKTAMINAVKKAYKETLGDASKDVFLEQANLLWMIQREGESFDIRKFK